ncbi:PREDICTED: anthocyanidin 3-O-glucosyltransferase 6-like [Ipomoea nil]|uniref:anthocyanidin 3-O-glucosyltransferase 6-like n=1 Tax=Ipomoea nil TaxID=35883 RepID=UPI0009013614|nr:PREDICTED: anthocyanidin 3-O-glucosyltransferase 6-like [Ipomoea nil]XP_019175115.1 PREDICTED: anthocyanidin 3-O-glucosyltransferase 6-like [Ipomoea nil]
MEDAIELVFIPAPGMGHLVSAVGTAKLLLQTRPHLSITILIIKLPFAPDAKINSYIDSLLADEKDNPRLKLVPLPEDLDALKGHTDKVSIFRAFLDSQKIKVRDYCVNEIQRSSGSSARRLAGFVVDMVCTSMMDVAEEFGVPAYVFFTSGAAILGLLFLAEDHGKDISEFKDSDPDLNISTYSKPFPVKLLPKTGLDTTEFGRRVQQAKGVIVNTFFDLEPHALQSLSNDERFPPIYPVGPILNLNGHRNNNSTSEKQILEWLDHQPASSVVFLCFGSGGAFPEPQVKEIAYALERSGQRFLWTLRKPPSPGSIGLTEYTNLEEVLPEGFSERTKSIGKVIGWAPQTAVLAHPAVGGFVSHCGWNSILESIWFGVPIATWPMCTDQQANAFQLVRDIGIGVEIKMDYAIDSINYIPIVPEIVSATEIEIGITSLMDHSTFNSIRTKAKELKEKSRKALEEGGSSFNFVESFFENVMNNLK